MNNKVINVIAFVAGAGIGSAATWYLLKDKFEKQYQEEINSVKERLLKNKPTEPDIPVEEKKEPKIDEKDKHDYQNLASKYDYTQFAQNKEEALYEPEEVDEQMGGPYVIPPEMYDDSDYDTVSLTYYSDGVLADSISDEVCEDPESLVGEFRSHFGEYEDDSVFVRNDEERIDFEILLDNRKYSDVTGRKYSNVANQDYE